MVLLSFLYKNSFQSTLINENPKSVTGEIFSEQFMKFTVHPAKLQPHVIATNVAMTSAIHQIYDNSYFAYWMKALLDCFAEHIFLRESAINKQSLITVFALLYLFDDIGLDFCLGLLSALANDFDKDRVELIVTLLQLVGRKVRNDNPVLLKKLVVDTTGAI